MELERAVEEWIDGAAKPKHSLGLLELYLKKMALAWGEIKPELRPYHLVFASDNGVIEEGIATTPKEVTYLQSQNMVDGKATISCFCRHNNIPYDVIDVGIDSDRPFSGIMHKAAMGSKNFLQEPAMTASEYQTAWRAGYEETERLIAGGVNLLSFGEMGVGNTTTSSAVLHALTGISPEFIVGVGAGLSPDMLKRKRQVVARGVALYKEEMHTVEDMLRCVGGFDMVAMCAAMVACTRNHTPFVIDGFIAAVAYVCATRIEPEAQNCAIPSHMSREPGMMYCLLLGNIPAEQVILRGELALGEGTGAVLMVSLLKTMMYTMHNMSRMADFVLAAKPAEKAASM